MSIPPLVCSTPPPPEQCEDDKDPDDFEMNYNLSQDDDNGDYDYGNFTSFNHFQSTSVPCQEIKAKREDIAGTKTNGNDEINHPPDIDKDKVETSEDVVEDLDLKIDSEPAAIGSKSNTETEVNQNEPAVKDLDTDITFNSPITQDEIEFTKSSIETIAVNCNENGEIVVNNEIDQKLDDVVSDITSNDTPETTVVSNLNDTEVVEQQITDSETEHYVIQGNNESNDLDEFEDFDDFQFISAANKSETLATNAFDTNDNPWDNKVSETEGFGEFKANFTSPEDTSLPIHSSEEPIQGENDSEDDFGDFDEFKSVDETKSDKVPVFNLQSSESEHQIIERINEVMHSIFQEDIVKPSSTFENRLEGSLGETWGHLLETDDRQPYIVNWNNSLAQKTLLKALCIDSRNILFGPKWNSNTPKYAANLSAAPLQPQKQSGQLNLQSDTAHTDKAVNKTSWVDPFTSDGQESCSTGNENIVTETGPTDLDVFEANVSTKPEKIYSNTLSIQPVRQINLPDTHIFTPTDSETPRSKTIHYDDRSAPTGLTPKPDNISLETDNDYWEFQDFRGTSQCKEFPSTANEFPKSEAIDKEISKEITQKPNYSVQTQVLQPVKLELVMPTLNWPNPGEVKETFDDFTDFMSNSTSHEEKLEPVSQNITTSTIFVPEEAKNNDKTLDTSDKLDDDFEMFQSAIPPFKVALQTGFSNMNRRPEKDINVATLGAASNLSDFHAVFPSPDSDKSEKSENISLPTTKPISNATKSVNNVSNMNELIFSSPTIPPPIVPVTNVLQPTIATPSGTKSNQNKTSQILQPLSLESYSQINWPNPGIDLQDLSRFNPVETLQSLISETGSQSKTASPVHSQKGFNNNQTSDDDIWGEFVSSKPKQQTLPKKATIFVDDDEWSDFVSSPSVNPHNGLNTISLNVHTNSGLQKPNVSKYQNKVNEIPLDIPTLNYITPKTTTQTSYNDRHFQNL